MSDAQVNHSHAAAVQFRQEVLAQNSPKMPDLNGPRHRWWREPVQIADLYEEK